MSTKRNRLWLLEVSSLLTLLIFLIDLRVSLNIAIPAFYAVGIVLVAGQRRIWPVFLAACICSILTFVPVLWDSQAKVPQLAWENRFIALSMIWIAATGGVVYLRQSELKHNIQKQLAPFFENSSLAVSIKDFRNHSVWINEQFRNLIGPADQVPGFTIVNAKQPATGEQIFTNLVNHREIKWDQNSLVDDSNQTVGTLCLGMDLTDRKRYEEALRISVEKRTAELSQINESLRQEISERKRAEKNAAKKTAQLQAMLEVNPDFFFHLKTDGTILGFESGKRNKFFPTVDESLHRNLYELLPPPVSFQFVRAIHKLSHTGTPASFEYTLKINKQPHWYHARLLPYLSEEILVIIQDINERKTAEIEMSNMHNRLSEAQRMAHIGSWEWSLQDQTLWWSEEVYCILGFTESRIKPAHDTFLKMIHEDDRELVQRVISNTLQNDLPFSIEHRILRPNGEIRHVHNQAALKKNPDGEPLMMHGTIQDLTEKHETSKMVQEYRDELAHVSRLAVMGELAAGLSHELNQPLTAIANYSSSMKYLLEQGGDLSELVSKIESQSLRSGDIVRRLKKLSEKRKQQRLLFNILESVHNALQLMNYQIRLNQIQVEVTSESKFITVYADRVQIEQVLVNLIKNAVEAMEGTPLPRRLTITLEAGNDSSTLVSVADTGKGVSEELADRLFTPFTTTKEEGLGIGLSLSRSLIDASDGKLWYRPNSQGGATFHISLPTPKQTKKVG